MNEKERPELLELVEKMHEMETIAERFRKMSEAAMENTAKWEEKYRTALCMILEKASRIGPEEAIKAAYEMLEKYYFNRIQREEKYIYSQLGWQKEGKV
jgi:hypothetical protein